MAINKMKTIIQSALLTAAICGFVISIGLWFSRDYQFSAFMAITGLLMGIIGFIYTLLIQKH